MDSKVNELIVSATCLIVYSDVVQDTSEGAAEDDMKEITGYHKAMFSGGDYVGKEEEILEFTAIQREKIRYEYWPKLEQLIADAKARGVLPENF